MKAKLSMAFADLRGKDGSVVISKSRTGLVLKPRAKARNPKSTAQNGVRSNLAKAAQNYKNFTAAQVTAWQTYAASIVKKNPISGTSYSPTAINAFVALASKFYQINPAGTAPTTPPTTAFAGDVITVTATAGTGLVTFTASAANAANVKTELLLQPLKSKNRVPGTKGYRTKAFFAFASGSLTTTVSAPTGNYAAAYRFVNTLTGQESALVTLPVLSVAFSVTEGEGGEKKKAA